MMNINLHIGLDLQVTGDPAAMRRAGRSLQPCLT
jgi:hypothetical protein